jgi:hypothetical protein
VDLSKANLWSFDPERMNMKGAILNVNGSSYIASKWNHTAWWQAKSISKNFLEELEVAAHFDGSTVYGAGIRTSKPEYCSETDALGLHDESTCNGQK